MEKIINRHWKERLRLPYEVMNRGTWHGEDNIKLYIYLIEIDCFLVWRTAFLPPWQTCWIGMQSFWRNCETFNLLEHQSDWRMIIQTVCDVAIAKAYLFCLVLGQGIGYCWRSWESLNMLIQGWYSQSLNDCTFVSRVLNTSWRYGFKAGNNPIAFAYLE